MGSIYPPSSWDEFDSVRTDKARLSDIEALKAELNQKAGERYLTSLCDQAVAGIDVISTRVLSFDMSLGVGGVPRGRFTEFVGPEQSGKTTVALQTAAVCQRMGGTVLYVDGEHSLDPAYCCKLGLDVENPSFILSQPDWGEQALNTIIRFARAGLIDMVVIDSIASLTPKSKLLALAGDISPDGTIAETTEEKKKANNADMDDFHKFVGLQARMYAAFCSVAPAIIRKNNVALLGLNQIRKEITQMGARESRPGGNAWFHAVSVRADFRRVETEIGGNKTDESSIGLFGTTKAHIKKNKVGVPHRQAFFDVVFGEGADYFKNLIETAHKEKVGMVKKGSRVQALDVNTGEDVAKSKYMKDMVEWLRHDDEGRAHLHALVDALGEKVGITLYDPTRPERKVGPIGGHVIELPVPEELEIAGVADLGDDGIPDLPSITPAELAV